MPSSRLARNKLLAMTVVLAVFALLNAVLYSGRAVAANAQAKEKPKDNATEKQKKEEPKKKVQGLPLEPDRTIEFTTDEGTWLSLDVSPDGKTIVFELLGDIYTLPIGGGEAKAITTRIGV